MNEPTQVRAVLLGHGGMPEGMVDAVRHITGCDPDVLMPVSNRGKAPDAMAAEVLRILGSDPGIVFTDLQSGSCGFVARRLTHDAPNLVVISGVNLPLLIDFAMSREESLESLIPRLLTRGRAAIDCAPVKR